MTPFAPTREALAARLDAVDVAAYGRSRNHLEGAVTRLSPYLTHGFISVQQVAERIARTQPFTPQDKLYAELAWREFYQHVWSHLGEGILSDIRPALAGIDYAAQLPEDIRCGATGLPVIDRAVRELYATGYLHNHARMWLASYVVHMRKIHWRAGADWMVGHLLDGDLASNHLSWQWVAATFSNKPYLFNAENVARFAPVEWQVGGTVLDASYPALEAVARSNQVLAVGGGPGVEPPVLSAGEALAASLPGAGAIELVHPWMLHPRSGGRFRMGVLHLPFHQRFPWSARRWAFVRTAMQAECDTVFAGDLFSLQPALQGRNVITHATLNPGYCEALSALCATAPTETPPLLPAPASLCASFSKFWKHAFPDLPMARP